MPFVRALGPLFDALSCSHSFSSHDVFFQYVVTRVRFVPMKLKI